MRSSSFHPSAITVPGAIVIVALVLSSATASRAQQRTLDIYWIDVEGGAATLVVSPSGESLLYDAGWEVDGRDGKRIAAVVKQAGLTKIDSFVLSHFHADHAGGLQELSRLVPISRCFDREGQGLEYIRGHDRQLRGISRMQRELASRLDQGRWGIHRDKRPKRLQQVVRCQVNGSRTCDVFR